MGLRRGLDGCRRETGGTQRTDQHQFRMEPGQNGFRSPDVIRVEVSQDQQRDAFDAQGFQAGYGGAGFRSGVHQDRRCFVCPQHRRVPLSDIAENRLPPSRPVQRDRADPPREQQPEGQQQETCPSPEPGPGQHRGHPRQQGAGEHPERGGGPFEDGPRHGRAEMRDPEDGLHHPTGHPGHRGSDRWDPDQDGGGQSEHGGGANEGASQGIGHHPDHGHLTGQRRRQRDRGQLRGQGHRNGLGEPGGSPACHDSGKRFRSQADAETGRRGERESPGTRQPGFQGEKHEDRDAQIADAAPAAPDSCGGQDDESHGGRPQHGGFGPAHQHEQRHSPSGDAPDRPAANPQGPHDEQQHTQQQRQVRAADGEQMTQ